MDFLLVGIPLATDYTCDGIPIVGIPIVYFVNRDFLSLPSGQPSGPAHLGESNTCWSTLEWTWSRQSGTSRLDP